MARYAHLEWYGKEHEHNPRSADWYWALGIIATAGAIAAFLFGDYLFSLLIIIAAATIAIHAMHEPKVHKFQIVDHGLMIGEELHAFEHMRSFSVLEDIEGDLPPLLSVKTENWLTPHLVIPLEGVNADAVYAHFLANVDEEAHHHSFADLVAAWLGF